MSPRYIQEEDELEVMVRYDADSEEVHAQSAKWIRTILTVGSENSGKSTALNNILQLRGVDRFKEREYSCVSKNIYTPGRKHIRAIDTPGLGKRFRDDNFIMKDVKKSLKKADFTLVYCLSVSPNSAINVQDKHIIETLHRHLGYGIWSKCVLLLTFSDVARRELFSDSEKVEEYKKYLKDRAQDFHSLIRSCGATVPGVLSIYDYENYYKLMAADLVAVPVGKSSSLEEVEVDVAAGMGTPPSRHWSYFALCEIERKTCKKGHGAVLPAKQWLRQAFIDITMVAGISAFGGFLAGLTLDTQAVSPTIKPLNLGKIGGYTLQAFVFGRRSHWGWSLFVGSWLILLPFSLGFVFLDWRNGRRALKHEREAITNA